ncbi:MAG: biopolymer transporter ExbD [Bacteroidetes bacterium]|nr:MAG: biopolymer transporter ExbD [Bacteroidota bacterium]
MPRVKLPRKSTNIDMTAMCDVAFLLLSFFILATKFKPPENLKVDTPESVSNKIAPEKDVVMITIDKEGRVFFSVSDNNVEQKKDIIQAINTQKSLGLSDAEMANFYKNASAYIAVPFSQLKSFLQKSAEELKGVNLPGIPVKDSTNNELVDWMRAAVGAFQGTRMNILVKGDNESKYPSFQGVIMAFKKNDQMKFQMITNPVAVPAGTELYRLNQASGTRGAE